MTNLNDLIPIFEFYRPVGSLYIYERVEIGSSLQRNYICEVNPVPIAKGKGKGQNSLVSTLEKAAKEIVKRYPGVNKEKWEEILSREYFIFIKGKDPKDDSEKDLEIYEFLTPKFYNFFQGLGIEFLQHPLNVRSENGMMKEWPLWFVRNPEYKKK